MTNATNTSATDIHHHLDTKGLICPEPVMMLHKVIRKAAGAEVIEILATDPASTRDIPNFCRHLGHELLLSETVDKSVIETSGNLTEGSEEVTRYDEVYRYLVRKKRA